MEHIPESMNFIQIEKHGDPDVLKLSSQSVPDPGLDEVLIRVEAAGVNRPDIMQRKGLYPLLLVLLMCRVWKYPEL